MFECFVCGENGVGVYGFGIGFVFVKDIVECVGGDVLVESMGWIGMVMLLCLFWVRCW